MYLHATEYKFKHIYDIKTLKNYCDYAAHDIQRAEEVIKQIKEYQMNLYKHVQEVLNTPTENIVVLQRSTSTGHVTFHSYLDIRPIVETDYKDGYLIRGKKAHEKNFNGRERHHAIKYAENLAKQYNCSIERKGFKCK